MKKYLWPLIVFVIFNSVAQAVDPAVEKAYSAAAKKFGQSCDQIKKVLDRTRCYQFLCQEAEKSNPEFKHDWLRKNYCGKSAKTEKAETEKKWAATEAKCKKEKGYYHQGTCYKHYAHYKEGQCTLKKLVVYNDGTNVICASNADAVKMHSDRQFMNELGHCPHYYELTVKVYSGKIKNYESSGNYAAFDQEGIRNHCAAEAKKVDSSAKNPPKPIIQVEGKQVQEDKGASDTVTQ